MSPLLQVAPRNAVRNGYAARLFEELKDTPFWCDNCGSMHPLIEHRDCRAAYPFRTAFRGAT